MAASKTARTIVASQSVTGGASGTLNLSTAFGCLITCRVTNGGSSPSTGCLVTVNVSNDNSTWRKYTEWRAATGISTVSDFAVDLPAPAMYVQVTFGSTSQAVTVEALGQELTNVS